MLMEIISKPKGTEHLQTMDPTGKVALVTGGANGIGLAIVKELLKNEANVVLCDVNVQSGKEAMKEITETYGKDRAMFIQMDVTKEDEFEDALRTAKKTFGRLDIVANNAGIFDDINWERAVQVNMNGVIRGTLLGLKHLGKDNEGNGGVIINTCSTASIDCYPTVPIYTATKHGVLAFTRCFGLPFHYNRTGVRVIALCPGATQTNLFANFADRLVTPQWLDETKELVSKQVVVGPETVGKSCVQLIREAECGSVWVSEKNEMYALDFPDRETMRRKP